MDEYTCRQIYCGFKDSSNRLDQPWFIWQKNDIVLNGVQNTSIININEYTCSKQVKLVMVGNLFPEKGQRTVMEAMNVLPEEYKDKFTLSLFGSGRPEYIEMLKEFAEDHQLSVTMNGYQENVTASLHEYDVGINCSKGEAFGLTTIEFMMAGLCVLVSDRGANTEIIRNQENGLVFRYDSVDSLSESLCYLYDHLDERIQLSCAAKEEALSKYTSDIMCENVCSIYKQLLD